METACEEELYQFKGYKVVTCPYCGAQYLVSEIFMPESLLDKAYTTHKNENGIIEFVDGKQAELEESYVCDYCNKQFKVEASTYYVARKDDVEEDYVTRL